LEFQDQIQDRLAVRSAEPPDEIRFPPFELVAEVDLAPSFQSARRASEREEPAEQVLHHPGMREEQPVTSVVFFGHEFGISTLYKTEKPGPILQPLEEWGSGEGVFGEAMAVRGLETTVQCKQTPDWIYRHRPGSGDAGPMSGDNSLDL